MKLVFGSTFDSRTSAIVLDGLLSVGITEKLARRAGPSLKAPISAPTIPHEHEYISVNLWRDQGGQMV